MKDVLKSWPWYFTSILATIAYLLMDFYMRKMIGQVADDIIYQKPSFIMSFLLLVGSSFLASPFHGLSTYTKGRMAEEVLLKLRLAIGKKTTKLSMTYLETHNSGEIISHLGSELDAINSFTYYGLSMVTTLFVQLLGVTGFMLFIDYEMTLVFISTSLLVLPFSILLTRQVRRNETHYRKQLAKSQQRAKEGIHFITLIKSFRLEEMFFDHYAEAIQKTTDASINNERTIAYVSSVGKALGFLPLITILSLGVWKISNESLTEGELLSLVAIGSGFFSWLQDTPDIVAYLRKAQVACKRIYRFLELPEEGEKRSAKLLNNSGHRKHVVKMEDVHFTYDCNKEGLNGISLEIGQGESVALVGASGSGKSTIFKLICGLITPDRGRIEVLGNPIEDWNKEAMRRNIALVSQKIQIFPGTLRENLIVDRSPIADARLISLCEQAGLGALLKERGLDGKVVEDGLHFSGGERQRISILRALLKETDFILLDEPTSALDAVSEESVQACLRMLLKGKTSLTIAHRMATIKKADRIYVLHQGEIVQSGSHEELIRQDGQYRSMLKFQELQGGSKIPQWKQ